MSEEAIPLHLQGNGRPVTEELTVSELKVTGSIPKELDGRYVRNGANPISGTSAHPFLGDGMIHAVRLDAVSYTHLTLPTKRIV